MNNSSCEKCEQQAKHHCLTCRMNLCQVHIQECQASSKIHQIISKSSSKSTPFHNLINSYKTILQKSLEKLENTFNDIISKLISLKIQTFTKTQEIISQLEDLEAEFNQQNMIGSNPNTILNKFNENPSETSENFLLSQLTWQDSLTELSSKITNSIFVSLDLDLLKHSEVVKEKIDTMQEKLFTDAKNKADQISNSLKVLKNKIKDYQGSAGHIPLIDLEKTFYRENIKQLSLIFENCPSKKVIELKCLMIPLFPNLEEIWLERLEPWQCEQIFPSIAINPKIKVLSLDRCRDLSKPEFKSLQNSLKHTNLQKFFMRFCDCLSDGINYLVLKLNKNSLTHLVLSGNLLSYEGSRTLANGLKSFQNLTHLNLRSNDLKEREIEILFPELKTLSRLESFDIACNELKAVGIRKLLSALRCLKLLSYLDISSNKLMDEDIERVFELFREDFKGFCLLQTLVLDMTTPKAALDVLRATIPSFTNIFVSNSNEISPLGKDQR